MRRTNPDSLRSCLCFQVLDATMRLGWELNQQPCDHGRRKNDAANYCATLPRSVLTRAANSIEFYLSSSSTYFGKFEFSNLIFTSSTKISFFEFRQMNIQNRDNFFTAGALAIKKIKIWVAMAWTNKPHAAFLLIKS